MSTSYFQRPINWSAVSKTSAITPEIQQHLLRVYTTLALTLFAAASGTFAYSLYAPHYGSGSFLPFIGGILLIVWLAITPKEEVVKRISILIGFGFLEGLTIAPLVLAYAAIHPSIVVSAFLGTVSIFTCFSASAYFAERRSWFFLGGFLSSCLSCLMVLGFLNIFFQSLAVHSGLLYIGLVVFCGYVIFDTQLIIEKAAAGEKDFVSDCLHLFLDFINIFVRLLIILGKDKKKERR